MAWFNLESLAVLLSLGYLVLAVRENSVCWYLAFLSTSIYVYIFATVSLYMESFLNVYYMGMAVYGWYQWKRAGLQGVGRDICRWPPSWHLLIVGAVFVGSLISAQMLRAYTDARFPFLDSFTTWGSIVATVMVARKVLENWLYWLVIDALSIIIFVDRELYQTALMFVLYLILAAIGYYNWRKIYRKEITNATGGLVAEMEVLEKSE